MNFVEIGGIAICIIDLWGMDAADDALYQCLTLKSVVSHFSEEQPVREGVILAAFRIMAESESSEWLLELLQEVQLEQFYVKLRDTLQVTRCASDGCWHEFTLMACC